MSLDTIRDYLSYDPETGIFRWIARPSIRVIVGAEAGCVKPQPNQPSRRFIGFDGTTYMASRLAWFFIHGEMPPPEIKIDHRNRNQDDNRISNLRACTQAENCLNRIGNRQRKNKDSGFKGVHWHPDRGKWTASFRHKYLGIFLDPVEAAHAYDHAAMAYDPEFARVNFPEGGDSCQA